MQEQIQKIINNAKKAALLVREELMLKDASYENSINKSGDAQLRVDLRADRIFSNCFKDLDLKAIASEEKQDLEMLDPSKELIVAFDPLDGSSLVESNLTIGSIFAIFKDCLEPKNLKASFYFLYGPRLELVVANALDKKLDHFIFNPSLNTWEEQKKLVLSTKGGINSPGGTQKYWSKDHSGLIQGFFKEGYRLRYSGGMVADLHQILCKGGGIFSYPSTEDAKHGKLRVFYEVLAFALVFELANGFGIDGKTRLLELEGFGSIHASTPCFFGSFYEINKVIEMYNKTILEK